MDYVLMWIVWGYYFGKECNRFVLGLTFREYEKKLVVNVQIIIILLYIHIQVLNIRSSFTVWVKEKFGLL